MIVLGVALGARGDASSGGEVDEDDRERLATVAGQALASIGAFSVGLFDRSLVGEGLRACARITGDEDDEDEDGIPNDATLSFDDCRYKNGFGIGTVNGDMRLRDLDRDERGGVFDADLELRFEALQAEPFDWSSATTHVSGTVRGHDGEGDAKAGISHFLRIRIDLERDGEDHTLESETWWRVSFDPDGSWELGDRLEGGEVRILGSWAFDIDGARAIANVETLEPLALRSSSCEFRCDDGEIAAEFGPEDLRHTLAFVWTGCNSGFVRFQIDDDDDDHSDRLFLGRGVRGE